MPDLDTFLEELSSAQPVPGGGSVAALSAAMAAGLLLMVAHLTLGRKRYEGVREQVEAIRDRALQLREQARRLADEDELAYRHVAEALARPRATEEERSARRKKVQEALKGAAEPPLKVMRVASDLAQLAGELAGIGSRSAISDVGTASWLASAAYEAARLNVEINLAGVDDPDWVQDVRKAALEIPDPQPGNAGVQQRVMYVIGRGGT